MLPAESTVRGAQSPGLESSSDLGQVPSLLAWVPPRARLTAGGQDEARGLVPGRHSRLGSAWTACPHACPACSLAGLLGSS